MENDRPFGAQSAPRSTPGCSLSTTNTKCRPSGRNDGHKCALSWRRIERRSYYLVGYRPANPRARGTDRRLEVRVRRPGVEVRARAIQMAPPASGSERDRRSVGAGAPSTIDTAEDPLEYVLPNATLPLRLATAPFAAPGGGAAVAIVVGVQRPALSAGLTEHATLTVRAFTPGGEPRGAVDQSITIGLPAAPRGSAFSRYDLVARMDLVPGAYVLRVSARSGTLNARGTLQVGIDVPDFTNAPLSISGVVVNALPGAPVAPVEAVRTLVPIVPGTSREFPRTARARAYVRVYEGGTQPIVPVTLAIGVIDDHDARVVDRRDTLAEGRFGAERSADETVEIPLDTLTPGEYLLRIEAATGTATARRDVRFTVR